MGWTEADARRSNRTWAALAVVMLLVPVVLFAGLKFVPYAWSWMMWRTKVSEARAIADYTAIPPGASYGSVVGKLGGPLYSGPGFENTYGPIAGVYYWRDSDGREIRGLVVDWTATGNASVVGSLKVGEW